MKKCIVLSLTLATLSFSAYPQGCVSIRNIVGFGQFMVPQSGEEPIKWLVNVNSRYFESWKTYQGTTLQHQDPYQRATNHIFVADISFTRLLENGWSVNFDVPFTSATRTSAKEHDLSDPNHTMYTTHAFGLSDIRVAVYKWMWDVSTYHKGNIQLGLGLKLPTGAYGYQDYYHHDHTNPQNVTLAPVNVSTQLGDGGTGFTIEFNSYYTLNKTISLYANGFYLISPRDQNGVSNTLGFTKPPGLDTAGVKTGDGVNSVPDGYTVRTGANFTSNKFIFSLGARMEGAPVHDLIGASNGLRRAGTIISVEPGINYNMKKSMIFAYVPTVIYKNSRQTDQDKNLNRPSPGGFADYLIFVGMLFKIQ